MIDLPATPQTVLAKVIVPALGLIPAQYDSPVARWLLLTYAMQESGLRTRVQVGGGPGRGLWQDEPPLMGLLLGNPASASQVRALCRSRAVAAWPADMYYAVQTDDLFACCIARYDMWCDPRPLPALGDVDGAFADYIRDWGPGAYVRGTPDVDEAIRQRFATNAQTALSTVQGLSA